MAKKDKSRWRARFANTFGALGYVVVVFQWVLALALFVPMLNQVDLLWPQEPPVVDAPVVSAPSEPSILTFIGVAVIVAIMLALTVYIMLKLPSAVVRTSRKVVHKSSDTVSSALLHVMKKPDTKKARERLAPRVVAFLKLAAVCLPVLLVFLSRYIQGQTADDSLILFMASSLSNIAVLMFMVQYFGAKILKVNSADIW